MGRDLGQHRRPAWLGVLLSLNPTYGTLAERTNAHHVLLISFYAFITLETLLKVFFIGWNHYHLEMRNKTDLLVWIAMSIILIIDGDLKQDTYTSNGNLAVARELVAVVRLLTYPRNIGCFADPVNGVEWENVITTIGALTFAFAEGFVSFWFTYAQLGVLVFGGTMPMPGVNQELDNSRFGQSQYYILNFNDMVFSFSTLFCCLRVSDFDVIAEGFEIVTNDRGTRFYFLFWYTMGTLLFFNILKSYFISVFEPGDEKSKSSKRRPAERDGVGSNEEDDENEESQEGEKGKKGVGASELDDERVETIKEGNEEAENEEEAEDDKEDEVQSDTRSPFPHRKCAPTHCQGNWRKGETAGPETAEPELCQLYSLHPAQQPVR